MYLTKIKLLTILMMNCDPMGSQNLQYSVLKHYLKACGK